MHANRVFTPALFALIALVSTSVGPLSAGAGKAVPDKAKEAKKDIVAPPVEPIKAGTMTKIVLDTELPQLLWINPYDDGSLQLIASDTGKWAVVASAVPGTYRIAVCGAKADKTAGAVAVGPVYITIKVLGSPALVGKGTTPIEPLAQAIQLSHAADKADGAAANLHRLSIVYDAGGYAAADLAVKTWGDLVARINRQGEVQEIGGKSARVTAKINEALKAHPILSSMVGASAQALTPVVRQAAMEFFGQVSAILEKASLAETR